MEIKIITTIIVCLGMFFGTTVNALAPTEIAPETNNQNIAVVHYVE